MGKRMMIEVMDKVIDDIEKGDMRRDEGSHGMLASMVGYIDRSARLDGEGEDPEIQAALARGRAALKALPAHDPEFFHHLMELAIDELNELMTMGMEMGCRLDYVENSIYWPVGGGVKGGADEEN